MSILINKYNVIVISLLLCSCSSNSSTTNVNGVTDNSFSPVIFIESFVPHYSTQVEFAMAIAAAFHNNNSEKVYDEEASNINYSKFSHKQRDIILATFKYLNTRIDRKEVKISENNNLAVKEIRKMIDHNDKVSSLPNYSIKNQWAMVIQGLSSLKGFNDKNIDAKSFLTNIKNQNEIIVIFTRVFKVRSTLFHADNFWSVKK